MQPIKNIKPTVTEKKESFPRNPRTIIKSDLETFKGQFYGLGTYYAKEKDSSLKYIFDANNKDTVKEMYYYLTASPKFNGNLNKGIFLWGNIGNGKTTMVKILGDLIAMCNRIVFEFLSCSEIAEIIRRSDDLTHYYQRPLIIDEIGRDSNNIKVFGTDREPITEILNKRYTNDTITFATSNYNLDELGKKYGHHIQDRLVEMFNVIELPGGSRRK